MGSQYENLATAAQGMTTLAVNFVRVFVFSGIHWDFDAQLNAATDSMMPAVEHRVQNRRDLRYRRCVATSFAIAAAVSSIVLRISLSQNLTTVQP